jgi:hypothetical protein
MRCSGSKGPARFILRDGAEPVIGRAFARTRWRVSNHEGHGHCAGQQSRRGGCALCGLALDVGFRDGAVAPEPFGFVEAAVAALDHRLGGFG